MVQISAAQSSASQSYLAMAQRQPQAENPVAATASTPAPSSSGADVVSLGASGTPAQAANDSQPPAPAQQPEVFAEIWRDGMRIGSVYTDGSAVIPSSAGTTTGLGSRLPYIRAQELSNELGGEVRFVNLPALKVAQTRSQLRSAYGV